MLGIIIGTRFTIEFGAMMFALGFFPGFIYIFNLFFTNKARASSLFFLYPLIIGFIASWLCFTLVAKFLSNVPYEKLPVYNGYIACLIVIELLLIPIHYFFLRKRSKKILASKKKAK